MSEINTPFADAQVPASSQSDSSNVSLQGGDPGYKKQDGSTLQQTSRHSNLDGGKGVDLTDSQSPDALVKRVG